MTVAATALTTNDSGANAPWTTASVSLKKDRLYILAVHNVRSTVAASNTPTVTGASQTWAQIATVSEGSNTNRRRLTLFRCQPTADASGTLTIDLAAQTQNGGGWTLVEITGAVVGSNGADAIVQSATKDGSGASGTSDSVTLAAFAKTVNAVLSSIRIQSTSVTVTDEHTNVSQVAVNTGTLDTQFKSSPDTSPSWTWSASATDLAAAVEIAQSMERSFGMVL